MRMLLVEDDAAIVASLTDMLRSEDTRRAVPTARRGRRALRSNVRPTLVDVALAQGNGFAVRGGQGVTRLTVSSSASDDEFSTVAGLDIGADDYIAKSSRPRAALAHPSVLR
ncbi:MAG: hypothetical protein ACLTMP_13260 [Eggerthella lenta]